MKQALLIDEARRRSTRRRQWHAKGRVDEGAGRREGAFGTERRQLVPSLLIEQATSLVPSTHVEPRLIRCHSKSSIPMESPKVESAWNLASTGRPPDAGGLGERWPGGSQAVQRQFQSGWGRQTASRVTGHS